MDAQRWNSMSVSEQILNIGGEIQRAVDRQEKGKRDEADEFLSKAFEWLELTKDDPKNKGRIKELDIAEDEVKDYFGANEWNNNCHSVMSYWDSFFSAIY